MGFCGKKLSLTFSDNPTGETKKTLDSTQLWLRRNHGESHLKDPRYEFEAQDVLFSSQMDVHESSWNLLKQGLV